ncbi:MAG TPA: hypothetical protein VFW28_03025 [Micropepsaceae bacterium]|nr:hypothetical protein [Micropepsaceae bacterium]
MEQITGFLPDVQQLLANAGKLLDFAAEATEEKTRDALMTCAADLIQLAAERSTPH